MPPRLTSAFGFKWLRIVSRLRTMPNIALTGGGTPYRA